MAEKIDAKAFREELKKRMPGFNWTVRRDSQEAEGIQSSGFNRLATIVVRIDRGYCTATYYGFGTRSPSLQSSGGATVAKALRNLQVGIERTAGTYHGAARTMQDARKATTPTPEAANV